MLLAPRSVVVFWPRGASVLGAAPPVDVEPGDVLSLVAQLGDAGGGDWAEHVRALDLAYGGWLPGRALAAQTFAAAQALAGARRVFTQTRQARPTLPVSIALRAQAIAPLAAHSIYLDDDIDGLCVLLAAHADVTVYEPDPQRRAWLEQAGAGRLRIVDTPPANRAFDLAVAHAGEPGATHAMLARVLGAVRDEGHLALSVRTPWDHVLFAMLAEAGLSQRSYVRDIDHWLLPTGHVVDGGGDLVIATRSATATLPSFDASPAALFRQHPFFTFDIDALAPDRIGAGALASLADRLAAWAPRPEAMRRVTGSAGRETLCWYDDTGVGLSAELHLNERHLMVTLMPNHAALELAVVCAAYLLFADELTRPRPLRTRRGSEEMMFG